MHDRPLAPDDPRVTAYALGELSGEDCAAVESALRRQPGLRATVDEIRATAALVQSALAVEALPETAEAVGRESVPPLAPVAIGPGNRPRGRDDDPARHGTKLLRFPALYYWIGGFAAAGFAMMVALRDQPPRPRSGGSIRVVSAGTEADAGASRLATAAGPASEMLADAGPRPTEVGEAAPPPVFLASDLTLMDQARSEREAVATTGAEPLAPPLFAAPPSLPAPRLRANLPAPFRIVIDPPPAYARTPSILPNFDLGSPGGGPTATPDDVVVLSAFTVTARRGGAGSGLIENPFERDHLPAPPVGAKFGRTAEASGPIRENDFVSAAAHRVSSFAVEVGTSSYANIRRVVEHGTPPPRDDVRIEEMLNFFPYGYAPPQNGDPFAAALEVAVAPWAPAHRLVRIGLRAREVATADRARANLVFLLDVSGSMNEPNKLPLVKESMRLLLGRLRADDRVAIVTYAGDSGLALPSTPVARASEILRALDALAPGGTTNGARGIRLAYDIAKANFAAGGINRVILCTDGDFNVGATSDGELARLVEAEADSGVFLTALGFGMGGYTDATLEKLAHHGHGHHGYIDTRREAERLLVEQVNGTLVTVAKDVRVEVQFNPAVVASYRLIGYENRPLRREDFDHAKAADAGEIGAGHAVTALYEIVPAGAVAKRPGERLLSVSVRYKKPGGWFFNFTRRLEFPLADTPRAFATASADFRFAAAVAQYGMILRGSGHRGLATMRDVATWAAAATSDGGDPGGYRAEFLDLVRKTQALIE